jgi:23S rRNA (adenine2503-C2)-methyltransferase
MEKTDIRSMDIGELKSLMAEMDEKTFRAGQIFEWLHKKLVCSFDEMTNLSEELRKKLKDRCDILGVNEVDRLCSKLDETKKFLFKLEDGQVIESVFMKYHFGTSVCISSQAGCRMGCRFCASTLLGLNRNLKPSEMLAQVYAIQKAVGERISNIVIMGTGEPLDNYDNLVKFLRLITNVNGLNIGVRSITVSTCGIVPNIRKLADEELSVNLALSLHAPNDIIRRSIMPVALSYGLNEIFDSIDFYYTKYGRRITFEYSLMSGVNDSIENAEELCDLLKGRKREVPKGYSFGTNILVNLIPVNEVKERNYKRSSDLHINDFKKLLEKRGINVTVRRELGSDINAACGQLRKSYLST